MSEATQSKALAVGDLSAWYGQAKVLDGVSLDVVEGEVVAVLGHNGAGKSTLLSSIARVHKRTTGSIELLGQEIGDASTAYVARAGLSFSREGSRIFTTLTVQDNLVLAQALAKRRGLEPVEIERVVGWFPALRVKMSEKAGLLSGGQRQMLAVGNAVVGRPKILLLDEPSAGLAPDMAASVYASLEGLRAEGLSMLITEQNQDWLDGFATRAYVLETGKVISESSSPETVATEAP